MANVPDNVHEVFRKVKHSSLFKMSSLRSLISTKTRWWTPKCAIQPLRLSRTASVEYDKRFPLWQDNQLSKSNVKDHIAVFACLTTEKFHIEAATILATVSVKVKIYSKKLKKYINMLLWEVTHEETKGLALKIVCLNFSPPLYPIYVVIIFGYRQLTSSQVNKLFDFLRLVWHKGQQSLQTVARAATMHNFCQRWSTEFLLDLQKGPRWKGSKPNIKSGEVVKECFATFPLWPSATIVEFCCGGDDTIRMLNLRTPQATLTHPIRKICQLSPAKPL
jgi:hypothetical protein